MYNILIISKIALLLIVLAACSELDKTPDIFPSESATQPTITSVTPDSAYDGIMEISISGENFSPNAAENFVYFGTSEAQVNGSSGPSVGFRRYVPR